MKNNSKLYFKENKKGFLNLYAEVELDNGDVAIFQVKQSFYNHKFQYLLEHNLPLVKDKD